MVYQIICKTEPVDFYLMRRLLIHYKIWLRAAIFTTLFATFVFIFAELNTLPHTTSPLLTQFIEISPVLFVWLLIPYIIVGVAIKDLKPSGGVVGW